MSIFCSGLRVHFRYRVSVIFWDKWNENEENIVLDEIGVTGHKLYMGKMEEYSLFLQYKAGILEGGLYLSGEKKVLFTSEYGAVEDWEAGLVCKTWGTGGNLKVTFRDIRYDRR